jgi:hypothetical protein
MASYQDLDSRVRSIEDKLSFVMQNMKMKAAVTSGVLDQTGRPVIENVFNGTLLELYHLSRQLPTLTEDKVDPGQAPVE